MLMHLHKMLWAFDIVLIIVDGKLFVPDADEFAIGLVSYSANFKYRFIPHSNRRKETIVANVERTNTDTMSLDGLDRACF